MALFNHQSSAKHVHATRKLESPVSARRERDRDRCIQRQRAIDSVSWNDNLPTTCFFNLSDEGELCGNSSLQTYSRRLITCRVHKNSCVPGSRFFFCAYSYCIGLPCA